MATWAKPILMLLAGLALLVGLIWLLVILQSLLVALIIAALLAYLLNPLVDRLAERVGGKRPLAAALVYLIFLALLAGPLALLGVVAVEQWPRLQQELQQALEVMQGWLVRPFSFFGFVVYPELLLDNLRVAAGNALSSITIGEDGLLSGLTENLLWALVVLVSLYYLLKDGHRLIPNLLTYIPPAYQEDARLLLAELNAVWGIFLRVQLFIFAVLAVLIGGGSFLIIWLFRQGWLPLSPLGLALLLVAMYAAIQQVDNLWLRPQLMGHALKLHPGVIFVGLIAGLALSGLLGALLIVPLLASLKVIARFSYNRLAPFWQEQTAVPPEEREVATNAPEATAQE